MMVNITKGAGITGTVRYCEGEGVDKKTRQRKVLEPGENSRSEILGGLNFGFEVKDKDSIDLARRIMEWQAQPENQAGRTKKCVNDCLHVSLSWSPGQNPTKADMMEAAQGVMKSMGMERARAVVFAHHDTEHAHIHIVASRIDPTTGKTFPGLDDRLHAQAWALKWERSHGEREPSRAAMHRLSEAVESRNTGGTISALMERGPTFTAKALDNAMIYGGLSGEQAAAFKGEVLNHAGVIGLREIAQGPVTRYTTREVIEAENMVLRDARTLNENRKHGISPERAERMAAHYTLTPEQRSALLHCTDANGFAMIAGEAGTGKSRTLNAIRATYEAHNYRVVGLSHTNKVVNAMREDGFSHANTLSLELGQFEGARPERLGVSQWDQRTVLMVDEAAMLSTRAIGELMARAREAGAKVILCGDDKQLASIERGGLFTPLSAEHGAAVLTEVMRVRDAEQKGAFNRMHEGDFAAALETFDKRGGLHFHKNEDEALYSLAAGWRADHAKDPDKARFIFAATNDQVKTLNGMARDAARESGRLGEDMTVKTAQGDKTFATGDRVQITGNGRSAGSRRNGYTNGNVGTITALEKDGDQVRMTIALDGKGNKSIAFVVGNGFDQFDKITHGYAGTIYKGQGETLDQTYLLHSTQWRAASSYVAMSRHRDTMSLYISEKVASDRAALAKMMAKDDTRHAATSYRIDEASLSKMGFRAGSEHSTRSDAKRPSFDPVADYLKGQTARDTNRQQQRKDSFRAGDPGQPAPEPAAAAAAAKQPETGRQKERREESGKQADMGGKYQKATSALDRIFGVEKESGDRQQGRDRDGSRDDDGGRERGRSR